MNEKYLEAKKMFVEYGYSRYNIHRESPNKDFKMFEEYKVPDELILEWAHEYQNKLLENIYNTDKNKELLFNFLSFSTSLGSNTEDGNLRRIINLLKNIEKKLDSFVKLRIGQMTLDDLRLKYDVRKLEFTFELIELENIVVDWLKEIIEGPVIVDRSHFVIKVERNVFSIPESELKPEKIVQDAKKALENWYLIKEKFIKLNESQILHEKKGNLNMQENYLEAKKLFNKYGNSIKNMKDDSLNKDHKTYLQYQVPEEKELEWIHDYQEKITVKILRSKNNKEILKHYLKLSENMCHNQYYKNLPSVIKQLSSCENEIDSFTKLRIAKSVINTIKNGEMTTQEEHANDINKIEPIIVSWLEGIIHKPIEVDDSFLEDIPETETFTDYTTCLVPENILEEAKSILADWDDNREIHVKRNKQ